MFNAATSISERRSESVVCVCLFLLFIKITIITMFQVVLMLLLATNYIPVVVNHLLMAFYSARVPFTCQVRVNYRVSQS